MARILFQVLLALNYMHGKQISHGDLKPENIIFETRFTPGKLPFTRLIDFGFAVDKNDSLYKRHGIRSTEFGTPLYMAPEKLYNKPLEEKSDTWSVGIMAYYMLAGYPPFFSDSEAKLFQSIKTCDYEFFEEWNSISLQAKDFVCKLLEPNLKNRMSAAEALRHKWMQMHVQQTPLLRWRAPRHRRRPVLNGRHRGCTQPAAVWKKTDLVSAPPVLCAL